MRQVRDRIDVRTRVWRVFLPPPPSLFPLVLRRSSSFAAAQITRLLFAARSQSFPISNGETGRTIFLATQSWNSRYFQ